MMTRVASIARRLATVVRRLARKESALIMVAGRFITGVRAAVVVLRFFFADGDVPLR